MKFRNSLFTNSYFPRKDSEIPFGKILNDVFFCPIKDNEDYPIHGPNVVRFIVALVDNDFANDVGLLQDDKGACRRTYGGYHPKILSCLGINPQDNEEIDRVTELLKVAALYHDIGKQIRRANHPQIGVNLIRHYNEAESEKLVEHLVYEDEAQETPSKRNRFTLISSIIEHHDKFGVVSTGEGAMPIFSDILYFTSNKGAIDGIKKNVTSVMLVNLADIAAVNTSSMKKRSLLLAKNIRNFRNDDPPDEEFKDSNEENILKELEEIYRHEKSCLGLAVSKVVNVLEDWELLINAITEAGGDRTQLKRKLLEIEQNPTRAIQRILRLLKESTVTGNGPSLTDFMTPTSVESILVSTLGPYRFQSFCEQLATIVKFDYGLDFFKAVMCAVTRKKLYENYAISSNDEFGLDWKRLSDQEKFKINSLTNKEQSELARIITTIFIKVLDSLVARYENVLTTSASNPRRFGFQMRDLTFDEKIRGSIIDLLCIKEMKDSIALTWITDEVTIWSLD